MEWKAEAGEEEEYQVEAILKQRTKGGRKEYYVKWVGYDEADNTWTCKFSTINLAQVPSFLLISAPRVNQEYFSTGEVDSDAGIRNQSANLYIKSIKLQVNNAQGHIDRVGDSDAASADFVNSERLFEMTRENAGSHYFKEGGFRAWRASGWRCSSRAPSSHRASWCPTV